MSTIVYTKPGCVQCNAMFRALDKAGVEYRSIDVSQDVTALEHIKAPVVKTETQHCSGFRPGKISHLPE